MEVRLYSAPSGPALPLPGPRRRRPARPAGASDPAADISDEASAAEAFRYLPLEEVRAALASTGYPMDRMHFVLGMVEDTIPDAAPAQIALCRLDTDSYASTRHEMTHLVPRIPPGGVLLVDDDGHFMGAKQAVDEHFSAHGPEVLLHRIDFSGRLVIIPER